MKKQLSNSESSVDTLAQNVSFARGLCFNVALISVFVLLITFYSHTTWSAQPTTNTKCCFVCLQFKWLLTIFFRGLLVHNQGETEPAIQRALEIII